MIAVIAATESGRARARHLAAAWPDAELVEGRPSAALPDAFARADGIVLFLAAGAAVRLLAPLLTDKRRDPGVVCVDDAGRFAVALCGGHAGGANVLAARVAETLGALPVVTTASEATCAPDLDRFGSDLGFRIDPRSDLSAVGAALVAGEPVALVLDRRWPLGPLPPNVLSVAAPADGERPGARLPVIAVSDRADVALPAPVALYRPPSLVAGVGCSRGATAGEILGLVEQALQAGGLARDSLAALASVDVKRDEPGLREAAAVLDVPLRFFPPADLEAVDVPNPSDVVRAAVGTPSVAEAAALLAAGPRAQLVVAKRRSAMATAAIARVAVRGRLALVSLGPGDDALLPALGREALARAEVVIGYGPYVESIRQLLRPGTRTETYALGEEVDRCRAAVEQAAAGASVALVSSGDVGIYAMASPALEDGRLDAVEVTVVPGITAANAAAALTGSPLGHDHCAISLSDLLTPWEAIRSRLEAAAVGDFVVSLYNPRSRTRDWQLDEARTILLEHRPPDTPVALVTDAYRPGQRVVLSTLAEFEAGAATMTTLVIVGSSQTRIVGGRMVTPRGYVLAGAR